MAELIQDFLEFNKMDYTLAIFKPECNLSGKIDRPDLAKKAGIKNVDQSQPLLLTLLNAFNSGVTGNATGFSNVSSSQKHSGFTQEEQKRVEPLNFKGVPEENSQLKAGAPKRGNDSTDQRLAKANNLLAELDREEKSGFNLRDS